MSLLRSLLPALPVCALPVCALPVCALPVCAAGRALPIFGICGLLTLTCFFASDAYAARRVCIKEDGKAVVKRRCRAKRNEVQLDLNSLVTVLQGPEGPQGATGAQGATGPQGPSGPEGPVGISGFERLSYTSTSSVSGGISRTVFSPHCPAGKVILSGSCFSNTVSMELIGSSRWENINGTTWRCDYRNWTSIAVTPQLTAEVVCAYIDS